MTKNKLLKELADLKIHCMELENELDKSKHHPSVKCKGCKHLIEQRGMLCNTYNYYCKKDLVCEDREEE